MLGEDLDAGLATFGGDRRDERAAGIHGMREDFAGLVCSWCAHSGQCGAFTQCRLPLAGVDPDGRRRG